MLARLRRFLMAPRRLAELELAHARLLLEEQRYRHLVETTTAVIAESHGGSVWLEEAPEAGAQVRIELPLRMPALPPPPLPASL